ncbi:MAG: hypothetical protein K6A45_09070 [Lachnospiraceae bacterium]|nr:hypothetical protein [Lachnospiraceae bacterium]
MTEKKRVYGIQKEFDCFTKKTLKYIVMSILRRIKRMEGHRPEITFFDDLGYEPLYKEDIFDEAEKKYEKIGEYEVPLGDKRLIKALKRLNGKNKDVIILYYFKMRYDAMRRRAGRPSKNASQFGTNFPEGRADDELAEQVGESRGQLHRYLRLVELIPSILELVDKKALALATAVEVSFLDHEVQQMLYEYMCENEICKTFQIFALRDYLKENDTITKMELMRILNENAPKDESNRFQQLTITKKKLQEYFPPFYTKSQMEKVLFDLLYQWSKDNNNEDIKL